MHWKKKPLPRPTIGETRDRLKFAWRPTEVKGCIIVWLEFYEVTERFFEPMNGPGWWLETERRRRHGCTDH